MNQFDRFVGGGIADLMAQYGNQPSALNFTQQSEPVIKMAGGGALDGYSADDMMSMGADAMGYMDAQSALDAGLTQDDLFRYANVNKQPTYTATPPQQSFIDSPYEDFGFTPYKNNQAVVPTAPAPVFQAPAAPAPPAGISPTPGVQFTPERELPFQQVQSTAAPVGIASLAPTQASVPAYSPEIGRAHV